MPDYTFYTKTALAEGLRDLLNQVEKRLSLTQPLTVYLAGGMAVHLYTAARVTADVDAEFSARVLVPNDLAVEITLENGSPQVIYLDTNYNSTFALMHEDYQSDTRPVQLGLEHIQVRVLSPVDLAVSKIARLADNDREDIQELARRGLTTAEEIEDRANTALLGYIGDQSMLRHNIRDAVALARKAAALDILTDAEQQERDQRIEAIPSLSKSDGATYTFWRQACAAARAARSPYNVYWPSIEKTVIDESIGEHGQSPESVAEALCTHSPSAVSPAQQIALRTDIHRLAPKLQRLYDLSQDQELDDDLDHRSGPGM
jgi:hypothetical protein